MANNDDSDILAASTLRIFWRATTRHKRDFYQAFLTVLGAILISVAVPFLAGRIFAGLAHQSTELHKYLELLAVASFFGFLFNRVGMTAFNRLLAQTLADLHTKLYARLLQRSAGYHANSISGKLIADLMDYVASYSTLALTTITNALSFIGVLLVGIVVVYINSWQLGVALTITVTITLIWAYFDSRTRKKLRMKRHIAEQNSTAHLADSIVNIQTIKTFASEHYEIAQNKKLNKKLVALRVRDWQRSARSGSDRMVLLLFMQFSTLLILMHLSHTDPVILATGIFAFTYTFNLTNRLFDINNMIRQVEESFLKAAPMTKMLLEKIEITDKPDASELKVTDGDIEFRDVTFAYKEKTSDQEVFENFSLHVNPGEKVGLVGPSGGGKSTLTRLILRFEEIQSGQILFDGQEIKEITQASLRNSIAYVAQDPLLFHRSISENIAYGKRDASQSEIVAAAKKANAHTFIESLPNGYDTLVGERGVKLSGGQRQRVAIARAILKDAPILMLDEATSALDSENEIEVQKALWELMKGRTVIVIAHRLSTIQKMDRIVVMVDGKIIEEGPHKKLLKEKNGTYARLWAHQSGGFIED
ncbi:MAG TPA: ABC transporter ATP-binding protein [Candidatus Saccharimonadales bacterium]|nr:ABC transporter ATP-binding protein [Candidatus Saccharimonadales bacterium]